MFEARPILVSTITCPHCGHQATETMPTNACQYFYDCRDCGAILKPKVGDCCVYCSYGDVPCPPIQEGGGKACCASSPAMARTTSFGADRPATIRFPDGAVIPDWSAVTTASARKALKAVFDAFVEPKWRGMDAVESQVRGAVLRAYAAGGHAPATTEVAAAVDLASDEVASALQRLAGRDLVVLDGAGRVSGAYPFTDGSGEHCVETGGVILSAMCAIDALGIGAMLGRACRTRSVCRHCRRALHIDVGDRGRRLDRIEPAGIVVWSGHRYAGGCAASSLCTLQAFFCDDEHLEAWRESGAGADEDGVRLGLAEALEVGQAIFAPMRMEMLP